MALIWGNFELLRKFAQAFQINNHSSSIRSKKNISLRFIRFFRVSSPCIVLTFAHRSRPIWVFGPEDLPPWILHFAFPLKAGAPHCCLVRFEVALQRTQRTLPPKVKRYCSICVSLIFRRTSWTGAERLSLNVDCLGYLDLLECLDYLEYVESLDVLPKNEGTQASQGIQSVSIDLLVVWPRRPCQTTFPEPSFG